MGVALIVGSVLAVLVLFWDYLEGIIGNFMLGLEVVLNSVSYASGFALFMPSIIGASITIALAVYIIKFIVGR